MSEIKKSREINDGILDLQKEVERAHVLIGRIEENLRPILNENRDVCLNAKVVQCETEMGAAIRAIYERVLTLNNHMRVLYERFEI